MLVSDDPDKMLLELSNPVLILVLVDVGLGLSDEEVKALGLDRVLILVLVDVGLGRGKTVSIEVNSREGLNPCFSGCWSRTETVRFTRVSGGWS